MLNNSPIAYLNRKQSSLATPDVGGRLAQQLRQRRSFCLHALAKTKHSRQPAVDDSHFVLLFALSHLASEKVQEQIRAHTIITCIDIVLT